MRLLLNFAARRAMGSWAGAPGGPAATGFVLSAPGRPDRPVHWSAAAPTLDVEEPPPLAGLARMLWNRPAAGTPPPPLPPGGEEDDDPAEVAWADMWAHRDGTMVLLRVRGEHCRDLARHWDEYDLHQKLGPVAAAEWGALDALRDER